MFHEFIYEFGCTKVPDGCIELLMALTQTVFLFYDVPVAISRLLVLSLWKSGRLPYSVLNRTQTKSRLCLSSESSV